MLMSERRSNVVEVESTFTQNVTALVPSPTTTGDYLKNTFGNHPKVQVEVIPHPMKAFKGGEDAYFVASNGESIALGIADGVGGWSHQGVDPSLVSKGIMLGSKHAFEKLGMKNPVDILEYGHQQVSHIKGSTTALVIVISEGGKKLEAANIGDSGFMIVRDGRIFYKSEEMQHFFNFPFQLGTGHSTTAHDAQMISLDLQEGDIVIAGSDALFDNLFPEEIVSLVGTHLTSENLAKVLALEAFHRGYMDQPSPFMKLAHHLGMIETDKGGKPDDITVLFTRIHPSHSSE